MKKLIKPILLSSILSALGLALFGCSSGLDPNTFSAEINVEDTSNFWSGNSSATVLKIRSNVADDVEVTNVKINNGQCGYADRYNTEIKFPQHFKMGNISKLYLKCSYNNVIQVDVETTNGTASYSFN